jgi:hypothetical protein
VVTSFTTDSNRSDGGFWVAGYHRDPGTNGPDDPGFDAYVDCVVRDSIISNNTRAPANYGMWLYTNCAVAVSYSDYYNNVGGGDYMILDPPTCTYTEGAGVIHEDPLFVDPANGDWSLQAGSPCVGTGDPRDIDSLETRADMGYIDYADAPYAAQLNREIGGDRIWDLEIKVLGHSEFGIPFTPTGSADPSDMFFKDGQPYGMANKLLKWDNTVKTYTLYPDDFSVLAVGQGYIILNYFVGKRAPSELDIVYPAVPIAPPGRVSVPRPGWNAIAITNGQPLWIGHILIRNEATGEIRTALSDRDAAQPWLNWNWVFWDVNRRTYDLVGFGNTETMVKPWYEYEIWALQSDLTLIFPGG